MTKTARQVLLEAADHIERYGKSDESFADPSSIEANSFERAPMCAIGAMSYAISGDPLGYYLRCQTVEARNVLCDYIKAPRMEGQIYAWSDSHTAEEVVAGLRGAAETIKEAPSGEQQ